MNDYDVIVSEMERYTGKTLRGKPRVLIRCPWHSDGTPSMAVTLIEGRGKPGNFTCFACGANSMTHGGWNGLAEKLHLQTINGKGYTAEWKSSPLNKDAFLTEGAASWETMLEDWNVSRDFPLPDGYTFRGIDHDLLIKIGARKALDSFGTKCTLFPLHVGGELVGGIKAVNFPNEKTKRKYINSNGEWSRTSGLFPIHYKKRWPVVIIVEGPRDAMFLLQQRIPALASLGTQSWSDAKRDLLLSVGCEFCFIAGDGDDAGRKMNKIVSDSLKGYIPRKTISIPDGEDPASLPYSFWKPYKKYF